MIIIGAMGASQVDPVQHVRKRGVMRIAIDGRTIVDQRSGIGIYAERIVRSLLRIDHSNHYILYLVQPNNELRAPNLEQVLIPGYNRMGRNRWWENVLFPRDAAIRGIDVLFSPANSLPFLPRFKNIARWLPLPKALKNIFNANGPVKYVATVHDLVSDILPETLTFKLRFWQRFFNSNAIKVADKIITVSDSTKRDLIKFYHPAAEKVSVVLSSVDRRFSRVKAKRLLTEVRKRYALPEFFILYIGTIEPRKNVQNIARAYNSLPAKLKEHYKLVLAGPIGWHADSIVAEIHTCDGNGSIDMPGYIDDKYLPALYSLASLFVFPSLYEGFGYPPLEAMACGVPVITSNTSSIPQSSRRFCRSDRSF